MEYHFNQRSATYDVLACLLLLGFTTSLELLELRVPAHVPLGSRAHLSCRWQLGPADVLYSVKWYKDGREFFRHVPRDVQQTRRFPLPGVDVACGPGITRDTTCRWQLGPADVLYSVKWYKDGREFFHHVPRDVQQTRRFPLPGVDVAEYEPTGARLVLSAAVLATGGRYRCEVSGERPLFPTVADYADLTVVIIPDHGPVLSGFRARYRIGDRVRVNCTSGRSRPATRLAWYVNGEPAPPAALQPAHTRAHHDGLLTTTLRFDFTVTQQHFRQNRLTVKCLATLGNVYWRSNEESALEAYRKVYDNSSRVRSSEAAPSIRAIRVHANLSASISPSDAIFVLLIMFVYYM